jgi:hypothetical protein
MAYELTDEQREILGREMQPSKIDAWVQTCFDRHEEETEGSGAAAVEVKIAIITASQSPHPYDEIRRRTYPDIGDQLDDLYHKGAFSDEMAAKLQAVKDANPKPE